ncbi:hypothetical protein KP509_06G050500 [Ceratopteris richardii]|uniref:Protein kinase domain-containing protein n=1 Tax=Ceratopteris richardii TaxID=49495 RepID=A0A8T2UFU9_CERRI|nr:hypothetical protein KP509_06G050500 [Ceratopteris richardii]
MSVLKQNWYAPPFPNAFKGDGALWLTAYTNLAPNGATEMDSSNLGRAVYRDSLRTGDAKLFPSFATSFQFQIITTRQYPDCGSGMAFFMSDSEAPPSSNRNGALGLVNPSNTDYPRYLFAVEFDTRKSDLSNDVSDSHVGVNINPMKSLNYTDTSPFSASACCTTIPPSRHGSMNFSQRNVLPTVARPVQACLQLVYNLWAVFSNKDVYMGFSATSAPSTQGMEGHVIYSWNLTNDLDGRPNEGEVKLYKVLAPVAAGLALLVNLILACINLVRRRRNLEIRSRAGQRIQTALQTARPFSYAELESATNGFDEKRKVGEGGYGAVYNEASIIRKVRHRYLLELHGWCYEEGRDALLVSQFMSRGSLDRSIFDTRRTAELGSSPMAQKEMRIKILTQAATALEYLHEGLGECVLHRDVKAANVLLSDDTPMEARLCDFGLARLIRHGGGPVTMCTAGTPGYVAPEILYNGVVLVLEVATGRHAISSVSAGAAFLGQEGPVQLHIPSALWSSSSPEQDTLSEQQLLQMLDSSLLYNVLHPAPTSPSSSQHRSHEEDDMSRTMKTLLNDWRCVVQVGLMCCHPSPESRPFMKEVSRALDQKLLIPLRRTKPTGHSSPSDKTHWTLSSSCASLGRDFQFLVESHKQRESRSISTLWTSLNKQQRYE